MDATGSTNTPPTRQAGKLSGRVVPVAALTAAQEKTIYELYIRYYDNVSPALFYSDLKEKNWVILLEDSASSQIEGFSTILQMDVYVNDLYLKAVFSGDTIIDRSYWGQQELVKTWCSFMGKLKSQYPARRLYWFLICKGYRTYLYLPLYCHEFYPRYDKPTPAYEQALINELGSLKYPQEFRPESGLVAFEQPHGNLREDMAVVPERRLKDPHVRFFLERNPHYSRGDELVCIAEISADNFKALARRMVSDAIAVQLA